MSEQMSVVECTRCGSVFTLSAYYRDWLANRGVKVVRPMLCPTCFMKVGPLPKRCGVIKWFNPGKHYGFISVEEEDDVFSISSRLLREMRGRHTRVKQPGSICGTPKRGRRH